MIDIRLRKITSGGLNAADETRLMVNEKVSTAFEAGSMLANGAKSADVIELHRKLVVANAPCRS